MVAVEKTTPRDASEKEPAKCSECSGTGTVRHWSEVAYFEDRRVCTKCDTGRVVDTTIAAIVTRAQLENGKAASGNGRVRVDWQSAGHK